jgi:acetyltransferase-like isoleucine patch superfamily enzyme
VFLIYQKKMKLCAKYYIIEDAKIGKNTIIRDFVNIYGCTIGDNCKIGPHVDIQKGVTIGDNCKIESHAFIPVGVTIENNVFIGPHVVFINDKLPRVVDPDWVPIPTFVKEWASIGAGSVVLCGVTIGERAMVAAGSVVTKDVPARMLVKGNPARIVGEVQK